MSFYIGHVPTLYLSLTPWCLGGRMSAGMVLLHLHNLLCSTVILLTSTVISTLFLMKKWQVHVISLGMCPTTVKQLFRCIATAYLSCSLSSQNVSNSSPTQGLPPYALVHMMAVHIAFDYELVTPGSSGCTWSLFLQPVLCTESVRCLDKY